MAQDDGSQTEANSAAIVFFLFRSSAAFALGVIFLVLPLEIADTGKPWYFWVGSSLAAFALGAVLFYVGLRRRPDGPRTLGRHRFRLRSRQAGFP